MCACVSTCLVSASSVHLDSDSVCRVLTGAALPHLTGLSELLDGLTVYTQRHMSRLDRLVRSTYLLDYTLASMKVRWGGV
jgi:hypothetical protein